MRDKFHLFVKSFSTGLLSLWLALGWGDASAGRPQVWGYGVKGCAEFLAAAAHADGGDGASGAEFQRYREWLAGAVTGLSLATDLDVLQGGGFDGVIQRLRKVCEGRPGDDFFTAVTALIRELNQAEAPAVGGKERGATPPPPATLERQTPPAAAAKPEAKPAPKRPAADDCKGGGGGSIANNPGSGCR